MDDSRFDALSKLLASRSSRRAAVSGGGVLGAAAFAARPSGVLAQEASPVASGSTLAHTDADFLFVQVAPDATWAPKEGQEGVYVLTITHQDGQTIYFSDRPQRIVGAAPTQAVLDGLGFTPANPPNAAIVAGEEVLVVELTNPVYDPAGTLAYDATPLAPETVSDGLTHLANQQADADLPADLGPTSLFIDSVEACSSYTDCWIFENLPGLQCNLDLGACSPGAIPGGSIDACWDWGAFSCEACDGRSKDALNQLCNDAYPDCNKHGGCSVNAGF